MDRIVEKIIPENVNNYVYFVYLWVIVETGLTYCGYHKGIPLKDGYYHSSKHKEFNKQFSNSNYTLKYEVFGFYKYEKEAKRYEGLGIRSRKNKGENMANISNSSKPFYDRNKVFSMYNSICNGEIDYTENPKKEIPKLGWHQSREEENRKHMVKVRSRIDDKGGSIENTDPLVIARGTNEVLGLGDEVGISGYHTGGAIDTSKHATHYKRIDIDLTGWTKTEITKLSSLFNDTEEEKLVQKKDDYKKQLVALWEEEGIEPDSSEAYDWLSDYKTLTIGDRTSVMERAKEVIDTKKDEMKRGQKRVDYHIKKKETQDVMETYAGEGVKLILMGSGRHDFDRIYENAWDEKEDDWDDEIHTVRVLIHHSSLLKRKHWRSKSQPQKIAMVEKIGLPYDIEYEELPYYESDSKKGE